MSPEFKRSVVDFTVEMLELEFGEDKKVESQQDADLLSGIVFGFIRRLAREACEVSRVKGKFDAECFTFACRKNLGMFKRMTTLLEAERHVRVDKIVDI